VNKGGDCYEANGKLIMDMKEPSFLCQGVVFHAKSGWHGHCWIEVDDMVIDKANGLDIEMPKELYYARGHIKDVKRYPRLEAMKMMLKTKHFGPWRKND
jgi:hypothetical protein